MPGEPITPTKLHRLRKWCAQCREAYATSRQAALALKRSGAEPYQLEDAFQAALADRYDYYTALRRLAEASARPCVKGSHVSPAAKARLIRNGTWRPD